jgi:ribosomal protein S13
MVVLEILEEYENKVDIQREKDINTQKQIDIIKNAIENNIPLNSDLLNSFSKDSDHIMQHKSYYNIEVMRETLVNIQNENKEFNTKIIEKFNDIESKSLEYKRENDANENDKYEKIIELEKGN